MTTPNPLTPATQAVMDAAYALPLKNGQPSIGAALRAAVDQVVPESPDCGPPASDCVKGAEDRQRMVRFRLLAIATELEGHHG